MMKKPTIKNEKEKNYERRSFIKTIFLSFASLLFPGFIGAEDKINRAKAWILGDGYNPADHYWSMGIDISKCIGCGRCVEACKNENGVPREPFFFRTWVERYRVLEDGETLIDSPNGAINSFTHDTNEKNVVRSFFVPKICNHCDNPPCVQVCPVGATFKTVDGVVLVDSEYCIGCRYCIQACPYGARYLDPVTRTAAKCTFCYHRIVKGLLPACVEVCPTQARIFGELRKKASPLVRFLRMNKIGVLKPAMNTEPKVFYAGLDKEVR
ncbi:MAG: 4Fe-4S dicluster domain-containing protein [candidate division KSB1 bacterium]|nr:4Fe-4S dicluster domain-containing protein [candidate division KSB1 bacterium]